MSERDKSWIGALRTRANLFCHKKLGWHWNRDVEYRSFDGASNVGWCRVCRAKVLMDSNGNWFRTHGKW